jgi:hypothetical protein
MSFWLRRRLQASNSLLAKSHGWRVSTSSAWHTFFKVCTEEMDDLSQKAIKLVSCLEVLEEVEAKIPGKASLARLQAALNELYENKVYQYRWALRHPVVKEAITKALANRFPSR